MRRARGDDLTSRTATTRPAAREEGGEVTQCWLSVKGDAIGKLRVTDVLDPDPSWSVQKLDSEPAQGPIRASPRRMCALNSGGLPMRSQDVHAELPVEGPRSVSGRHQRWNRGASMLIDANAGFCIETTVR